MRRTVITITVCAVFAGCLIFLMNSRFKSHRAFKWFDKLGFPDVKGCKFVKIEPDQHWLNIPGFTGTFAREGFLLSEDSETFKILALDLFIHTLDKNNPDMPWTSFAYRELDLEKYAEKCLKAPAGFFHGEHTSFEYPLLQERTQVFVLAWTCWRNGHKKLAYDLCDQVLDIEPRSNTGLMSMWDTWIHTLRRRKSLITALQRDIGHALMWRAVIAFGDPAIGRDELCEQFERIVKCCSKSEHRKQAAEYARMLRKMIKEDTAHVGPDHPAVDQMSQTELIADLVFHLRDQCGKQYAWPGHFSVLNDFSNRKSPAEQLVDIGYDAAPQLVEALDDYSFSRSVGCWRPHFFNHDVLRVNDCALEVIEIIARRSFYGRSYVGYLSQDGRVANDYRDWGADTNVSSEKKVAVIRKEIESWWHQLQTKGEKQLLIDAARAGGRLVTGQAALLIEKYPAAAAEPLIEGARCCEEDYTRSRFIQLFGQLDGEKVESFLYEQMGEKTFPQSRVEAARVLYDRGKLDVIATILKAWEQLLIDRERRPLSPGGPGPRDVVTLEDMEYGAQYSYIDDGLRHISQFLIDSEVTEAIEVLGRDMQQLSIYQRTEIIGNIGNKIGETIKRLDEEELLHQEDLEHTALPIMEKLLVSLLHDTEVQEGLSSYRYGKDYKNPRVCDTAALMLWHHFVDKYEFDIESPQSIRDKQIQKCIKTWEASNSLAD